LDAHDLFLLALNGCALQLFLVEVSSLLLIANVFFEGVLRNRFSHGLRQIVKLYIKPCEWLLSCGLLLLAAAPARARTFTVAAIFQFDECLLLFLL
jgi:hypothetical protein